MDTKVKPLQSHDMCTIEWTPPKSNTLYYNYTKEDTWLKDLKLGTLKSTKVDLYDVRDRNNKLIGYTKYDPTEFVHCDGLLTNVCTNDNLIGNKYIRYDAKVEEATFRQIHIRLNTYRINSNNKQESFVYWLVTNVQDAIDLVRSGWIECLGEDNINRFCCRIYEEHYKWAQMERMFTNLIPYKGLIKSTTV